MKLGNAACSVRGEPKLAGSVIALFYLLFGASALAANTLRPDWCNITNGFQIPSEDNSG